VNDVAFNAVFNVMLAIRIYDSTFLSKNRCNASYLPLCLKRKPEYTADFTIFDPELGKFGLLMGTRTGGRNRKIASRALLLIISRTPADEDRSLSSFSGKGRASARRATSDPSFDLRPFLFLSTSAMAAEGEAADADIVVAAAPPGLLDVLHIVSAHFAATGNAAVGISREAWRDVRIWMAIIDMKHKPKKANGKVDVEAPRMVIVSRQGRLDVVQRLLDFGANIEAKEKDGYTALAWACR